MSHDLRSNLSTEGFKSLGNCGEVGVIMEGQQHWVYFVFLVLEGNLKDEWTFFMRHLKQSGILLRNSIDMLSLEY
jgi:uncharacterized protein (DUF39 family)